MAVSIANYHRQIRIRSCWSVPFCSISRCATEGRGGGKAAYAAVYPDAVRLRVNYSVVLGAFSQPARDCSYMFNHPLRYACELQSARSIYKHRPGVEMLSVARQCWKPSGWRGGRCRVHCVLIKWAHLLNLLTIYDLRARSSSQVQSLQADGELLATAISRTCKPERSSSKKRTPKDTRFVGNSNSEFGLFCLWIAQYMTELESIDGMKSSTRGIISGAFAAGAHIN